MTAVDWLLEELKKFHHPTEAMIMYAKKLEKQQIVDAFDCDGSPEPGEVWISNGVQYYDQTYK